MNKKPKYKNLEIEKGTTKVYDLYLTKDGLIVDITNYTVYFTAKENVIDSDALAKINIKIITHTEPSNGKTEIKLTSLDTNIVANSYYYAIDVKDDEDNIVPLYRGNLLIVEPIRKTKD